VSEVRFVHRASSSLVFKRKHKVKIRCTSDINLTARSLDLLLQTGTSSSRDPISL
jgi:hypothetical protein